MKNNYPKLPNKHWRYVVGGTVQPKDMLWTPEDQDWWYKRAASILRKIYRHGPIGTNKLKKKYGSKKNRGHKPEHFYKAAGSHIRKILQQLEKSGLKLGILNKEKYRF